MIENLGIAVVILPLFALEPEIWGQPSWGRPMAAILKSKMVTTWGRVLRASKMILNKNIAITQINVTFSCKFNEKYRKTS
jgi:hypothetical protein